VRMRNAPRHKTSKDRCQAKPNVSKGMLSEVVPTCCKRRRRRFCVLARTSCTTWRQPGQVLARRLTRRLPAAHGRSSSQHSSELLHELPKRHPRG
jgi:cation transport regulator ChaC